MADPVISLVIERTVDLLIQKIVFLKGVRRQVERLQNDLVRMRCFLKDADQRQTEDERIRNWVSEIRAAAYDAEDVIEIFASKVEFFTKDKGLVTKLTYYPLKIVNLYKTGKEIESLRMRVKEIADSRQEYGIKNLGEGTNTHGEELQRLRRSSPLSEDMDIDENRRVVSIIGMGGAGKTTLAKKVYNHADVRARFNCRAWVCVSSSYDYKKILSAIIKQLNEMSKELLDVLEKMEEEDLERRLYQDLQDKCYLVVLDDVWKEEAWDCLARRAFPDGSTSSRLLLTSRNRDVVQHADALSKPHELKTLGQEDSWQLFLRKALGHGDNAGCPPDLEEVGREIARRCAGLPLAITVIGGLLRAKKKLKSEWEKVLNNFNTNLSRGQVGVSAILELSYADLPANLKFCFLYLGLFPKDYVISVRKLIHMWVAEGIMQKRDAENLEETAAYDDVEELSGRNMVQVAEMTVDERIKSCRVHDLLRELAIRKAEDENFFQIHHTRDDKISAKSSLQKLGIWVDDRSDIDKLCMHLSEVISLKTLHLCCPGGSGKQPQSLGGLSKLHHVTELKLSGLRMLPPYFPPNLSRLSLKSMDLMDDPMPVLEKLGQLSFLKLEVAYVGPQLVISRQGFHQLKFIELSNLRVDEIKVETAALPQLQCLRIRSCRSLWKLPEELKQISTLDALELVNMPEDFISRLDADMASGVPNLRILDYSFPQRSRRLSLLEQITAHARVIRAGVLFQPAAQPS
ncbi:unnamed protein product [Coffea canephora]|uniref:AAA+ ATPase domain-containing protein n=1 Tax=Coffea canephora TaxID=49390 RepID=A0A068UVU2_COFCA|nr:unnamed protein product [Coffea canephora]